MSLGVLNNLSAVYAENNLNNSNSNLSKTLQQLSSGSRINSGADDAAGLSLVDGLQANQTALNQSETNSSEGAGLLQVADGALSQVTSLLNRAVTLATEAANGTLNSSQDTAANQEYQSILSEISNIGSTTTYNQQAVFGSNTNIYTGDSSTTGASVDDLNIHALSSANVGDSSGAMAYTNGQGNVFINLSSASVNANRDDSLGAATNGITITSLAKGAFGTVQSSTATVSAGASPTVGSLISAINNDTSLGLHASFVTEAQAGMSANPTYTGIELTSTSGAIGQGTAPGVLGTIVATAGADTFNDNTDGITITTADGVAHDVAINGLTSVGDAANASKLTDIANTINGMNLGVTASVDGTNKTMTLTSSNGNVQVTSSLYDNTGTAASIGFTKGSYYAVGISVGSGTATAIHDTSTTETDTGSALESQNASAKGGVATISYSDGSGQALNSTDLTNQTDAQLALTSLNAAITDVAAQDGYIGAQINTLNAVSNVLATQSENVQSAQNAVQATDYAQASSNMSKFEILSQTGISALAQANSMQQEVTKLLRREDV